MTKLLQVAVSLMLQLSGFLINIDLGSQVHAGKIWSHEKSSCKMTEARGLFFFLSFDTDYISLRMPISLYVYTI